MKNPADGPLFHEGFYYTRSKLKKGPNGLTRYFKCRKIYAPQFCPASVKVMNEDYDNVILINGAHNHKRETAAKSLYLFRVLLKQLVKTEKGSLDSTYRKAAAVYPEGAELCTLKTVRTSMFRWRRRAALQQAFQSANALPQEGHFMDPESGEADEKMVLPDTNTIATPFKILPVSACIEDNQLLTPAEEDEEDDEVLPPKPNDHEYAEPAMIRHWIPRLTDRPAKSVDRTCKKCSVNSICYRLFCGHLFCGKCSAYVYNRYDECFSCKSDIASQHPLPVYF